MKKCFMTLCCIASFLVAATAQTYQPFPEENVVWTQLNYASQQSYESANYYTFFIKGDTTLNGTSYKKMYSTNAFTEQVYPVFYMGGMRQDTAARKVYFISYDS